MMPFARYFCIFINVGLGEGSALPVGVPVPWPSATPPTGWLKCNGAAFSAEEYPELAKAYPTNKLPDLRGEFIRGWDDGRGVDSGRTLLTNQEHAVISHNHGIPTKVGSVTNIPYGIEQLYLMKPFFHQQKQLVWITGLTVSEFLLIPLVEEMVLNQ
ncbi:phage tail protein [Escherichia coli]